MDCASAQCRPTAHDGTPRTVNSHYCAVLAAQHCYCCRVCITHAVHCGEESWSAMVEWVMIDAAVWHNGRLSHANFFRFAHLMLVLAHGYSFQIVAWSRKALPGSRTWGERKANFFLHFLGKKHFCRTDFFETSIRAITQSISFVLKRNQISIPLPSWCTTSDTQTDRTCDRQLKSRETSRRLCHLSVMKFTHPACCAAYYIVSEKC